MVLTAATHLCPELDRFVQSAIYYGYTFKIIGLGGGHPGPDAHTDQGLGWRISLMQRELCYLSPDQLILFTDSYDAIFCANPYEVVQKFLEFDHPILFSSEINAWPDESFEEEFPPHPTPYRFLNAGGYIARAGALVDLIGSLRVHPMADDQRIFSRLYLDNPGRIALDHECRIFQTLMDAESHLGWNSVAHRPVNQLTNTQPCVLHGNGPSASVLDAYSDTIPPPIALRPQLVSPNPLMKP